MFVVFCQDFTDGFAPQTALSASFRTGLSEVHKYLDRIDDKFFITKTQRHKSLFSCVLKIMELPKKELSHFAQCGMLAKLELPKI